MEPDHTAPLTHTTCLVGSPQLRQDKADVGAATPWSGRTTRPGVTRAAAG